MIFRKERSPSRQNSPQSGLLAGNIQQPHPFHRCHSPLQISLPTPKTTLQQPIPINEEFQTQFRKMYAGRKNVRKSLKSWDFLPQGHITGQQFTERIQKNTSLSAGKEDLGALLNSKGLITAESFVDLAFGSNIVSQSKLSNFWESNPYRQRFLENYHDKVYNQSKQEIVSGRQGIQRVMRRANPSSDYQSKEIPHLFTQREQPHRKRERETQIKPSLLLQHNTRISAAPLHTSTIQLGSDPLYMKIKQKKHEVEDRTIKQEVKLERIRKWHEQQKENIAANDRQREKRQQANMARSRGQREAYDFVAYCKNNWG